MKRVACTIVSANYLHFAWTLAESFLRYHPDDEFHLLLVDKMPGDFVSRDPRIQVLAIEELGLPAFQSLAFKYDILELNTGVKPSYLKYLFALGADKVIYFDPDIYIFNPVELIYEALDGASIVLTPHILSSTPDKEHVYERDFLGTGVFNLGFVAVAATPQGRSFLDWWEERCLDYCFEDLRSGLFVDQKWINLVPCLFSEIHILRDPGCNVAYWNLHERSLIREGSGYLVNGNATLTFFHYSGYSPSRPDQLSRKLRVPQYIDDTLRTLLLFYGERLHANGADSYQKYAYAYKCFSNGLQISSLARRLYSVSIDQWGDQDPFDANGTFYAAAKKAGLLSKNDQAGQYSTNNLPVDDMRVRTINRMLFALPKIIGGDRYTMLMKYLSFITILRNQRQLLLAGDHQPIT
ncbi:group 1 glycosyl transferase [Edaphobacter sp. 12200R-103]|uniref:group 1 glycosyl transferase n=1 Tax=Edaphobacter sp. 12200R-103 TaxID=2703788 RepID=UPI00138BEA43|nr:group 1 glycosyl transferase [Edaphobacter sp. 12200R-103]QHS52984.1 group 1 glycosyl transferase [Edaphobacter sp. 12200R-103]